MGRKLPESDAAKPWPEFERLLEDADAAGIVRLARGEQARERPLLRSACVRGLAELDAFETLDVLEEFAREDPDAMTRFAAVVETARRHSPAVAARFYGVGLDDAERKTQLACMRELARIDHPSVAAIMRSALRNRSPEIRAAAARAIGERPDNAAVEALIELLTDRDARTRSSAARALSKIGGERAAGALEEAARSAGRMESRVWRKHAYRAREVG